MKRVLTVGVNYTGEKIEEVEIENLGLCSPDVDRERSAYRETHLGYVAPKVTCQRSHSVRRGCAG